MKCFNVRRANFYRLMAIVFMVLLEGCGKRLTSEDNRYEVPALHGRVVDAETGRPIVGVLVSAFWYREESGTPHGGSANVLTNMFDVLTNDAGEFVFPSWVLEVRKGSQYITKLKVRIGLLKKEYGLQFKYVGAVLSLPESSARFKVNESSMSEIRFHAKGGEAYVGGAEYNSFIRPIVRSISAKNCLANNLIRTIELLREIDVVEGAPLSKYSLPKDMEYLNECK